jgi:nucleoside 2-deoxyribosyltransferase
MEGSCTCPTNTCEKNVDGKIVGEVRVFVGGKIKDAERIDGALADATRDRAVPLSPGVVKTGCWPLRLGSPGVATAAFMIAWEQIFHCDVYVAHLSHPDQYGTLVEIGWAYALRKPVIVTCDQALLGVREYWFALHCSLVSLSTLSPSDPQLKAADICFCSIPELLPHRSVEHYIRSLRRTLRFRARL